MSSLLRFRPVAFVCLAVGGLTLLLSFALPRPASAKSHLWKFKEIFSNAEGSVQYVEMDVLDPSGTGEWETLGRALSSGSQTYIIPIDLPQQNTFQRSMLFATPAFANLPGAPTPDFVIPPRFFDPAGDEIRYRFTFDIFSFAGGELPTNGQHALQRSDRSTPLNSPENFAGVEATIDAPGPPPVSAIWPPLLALVAGAGFAFEAISRRRRAHRAG